jgi:N-methylhydantoinase A
MNGLNREWEVGTDIRARSRTSLPSGDLTDPDRQVPSRPHAPVMRSEAIEAVGLRRSGQTFVHGTTRVTNAIVEERLPKVALIATAD